VPVVSAVGHETNLTLADLVADLRAATPSAAAELLVPDVRTLRTELLTLERRAHTAVHSRLSRAGADTRAAHDRLLRRMTTRLSYARGIVQAQHDRLRALSPRATLARGYAIARLGDSILTDADAVSAGDELRVELHRGRLTSTVQAVEPEV
jgi:exodeoxyribonuclease VII large subunit